MTCYKYGFALLGKAQEGMGLNILKSMRNEKSDLDLAWKMLDNARAIVEKSPADQNMEKVKIFSALAATSMERGILSNIYFSLLVTVLTPEFNWRIA
jgi:hypothetical protein